MKKNWKLIGLLAAGLLFVAGCSDNTTTASSEEITAVSSTDTSAPIENTENKGRSLTEILSGTNWQGTRVYDKNDQDLTEENQNFIGLAKYDGETGFYEFFDRETGETRGDEGIFFITADGEKRILISNTQNYQAVVSLTELTNERFTYKRMGVDKDGNEVEVYVEHIPYEEELTFTNGPETYTTETGPIDGEPGDEILGAGLWNGTKVVDEAGNDVTEANKMFISLAKFAADTNQYEFFDLETGETRGDYGYFAVLDNNKIRAHVSIGENPYAAVLEITELNPERFTYKRMGQDAAGNEITVFVEHEPYTGDFDPDFTF